MTLHQFPNPESIAGSGKGTQFPGSLSYFPVLCSVLGAAVIKTTMPALKVCTFLITPVLLSLFQGRGFPVTGQTFSPLQPTRSLFGFPRYAPSLSLFRPSPFYTSCLFELCLTIGIWTLPATAHLHGSGSPLGTRRPDLLQSCTVGSRLMLFLDAPSWLSLALLSNECHEYVVVLIDLTD